MSKKNISNGIFTDYEKKKEMERNVVNILFIA